VRTIADSLSILFLTICPHLVGKISPKSFYFVGFPIH
jgi:hypothetical protein